MFQSLTTNFQKIANASAAAGSTSLSINEFQTMISGGVLQEIDAQIEMFKGEIEANNSQQKAIRDDISTINKYLARTIEHIDQDNNPDTADTEMIQLSRSERKALVDAAASLGFKSIKTKRGGERGDFFEMNKIITKNVKGGTIGRDKVTVKFLESIKEALENKLSDLGSSSEMDTIKFQALMDARKQNIMMLSNLMNSDHQTKMSIMNNMKS